MLGSLKPDRPTYLTIFTFYITSGITFYIAFDTFDITFDNSGSPKFGLASLYTDLRVELDQLLDQLFVISHFIFNTFYI